MERTGNPLSHSESASSGPVQIGTFVQHGEDWTIGYGGASFLLRNVLGLTYIQCLLQHPGEQIHALDLLTGTASGETSETDASGVARLRDDESVVVGRPGDTGPILDEQAKREYRRRIAELNEELAELREQGGLNLLGESGYQRREEVESEIEALSRQLAQAVGIYGRDRRSGSAAERARLNVTRAIRTAIQNISERNAQLGDLLGACIRTGTFCSNIPNPGSPIEWKFALEGLAPATMAVPALARLQVETSSIQPLLSRTTFVGREEERELLRRCLQQVKNSQGRIVIIAGPPGIGKTWTAREAGEEARQQGFVTLAGNCYDREDSVPFVPFVELLEVLLSRAPGPAGIREILGDQAAELTRLLPQLRRLFPDLPEPLQLSPEQSRRMLFNAILELINRQSALNPLLVLLEDLHWADEGTLSLLVHLGRSITRMPVIIIATHRDDDIDMKPPLTKALEELSRLGVVERIPLGGLPERAVAQMIQLLTGQEPSPALVDVIYSNTDGNPLFVQELVRHLDEKGANGDLLERLQQVPHSLRLVIRRRLALLSKDATRVLGTAAVIGRSFNFGLLEAATHADPDWLLDAIEEAEKAGLISSRLQYPEARFRFAHELICRAVLDEVSAARRQRLHLNIAEAMELLYPNSLEDHAEDLAHHFWSAGVSADRRKTVRYLQTAGEKAARSSANNGAIGHFRKAIQLIRSLPETPERLRQELSLEINLGAALMATKGFPTSDVVEVHARARELSQRVGEATQFFRVLWGQWLSCAARGEHRAALQVGQQCLQVAQSAKDPLLLAQAHHALGAGYCTTGDFTEALEHLEQAVTVYDPVRQRSHADTYGHDPAALSLILSGFALWFLGYPDQALKRNDEGLALAQKVSHPATSAMAAAYAAQVQQFCRNGQTVEELATLAIDLSTRHDFAFARAMGTILGGWAMTQRGQKEAGIARMRLALEALRASGAVLMMGYFSLLLAGEVDQPEEGLRVLAGVDSTREHHWAAELYRLKGELLLRPGEHPLINQAEAEQCFGQALTISRGKKAKSLELRAAMSVCRLRLRQGKPLEARLALEEIFRSFTEGFDTPDLRDAKTLLEEL